MIKVLMKSIIITVRDQEALPFRDEDSLQKTKTI